MSLANALQYANEVSLTLMVIVIVPPTNIESMIIQTDEDNNHIVSLYLVLFEGRSKS